MTTEPTPELSRDEVASSLLDAWRSKHGPQIPADLYANVLDPLLDEVFSIPLGIIWSVFCTFDGEPWTLAGFNDNSLRVQRIESDPGPGGQVFVVREVPYEPIQYSERKNFTSGQMEIRAFVPRFGEILAGPYAIATTGATVARTFQSRAKGLTTRD